MSSTLNNPMKSAGSIAALIVISGAVAIASMSVAAPPVDDRAPTTKAPPSAPQPSKTATPEATPAPSDHAVSTPDEVSALPPLPATPAAIAQIVAARPFVVLEPWSSDWNAERSSIERGWIVVVRASHELVVPRQTQEPVLLAGARVAERLATDPESNLILAIIPATPRLEAVPGLGAGERAGASAGAADGDGLEAGQALRPLAELTIWFGTPGLPEQFDRASVAHEVAVAHAATLSPRSLEETVAALKRGGAAIAALDRAALLEIVEPWARAQGVRAPDDRADETPIVEKTPVPAGPR